MTEKTSTDNFKPEDVGINTPDLEKLSTSIFQIIDSCPSSEVVMRSNCKFCCHPVRQKAEEQYERSNRTGFSLVEKIFREYETSNPDYPKISYSAIRSHLVYHYAQQEKQIRLKEYSANLRNWLNYRAGNGEKLEIMKSTLEMKFHDVASLSSIEPSKQADTLSKLTAAILSVINTQAQLTGDIDSASLVKTHFMNVWANVISAQKNPIIKQELVAALEMFREEFQGIQKVE